MGKMSKVSCFGFASILLFLAIQSSFAQQNNRWTSWSSCSRTCGVGISKRIRMCSFPYICTSMYRRMQVRTCMLKTCQDYCGRWSECSKECGYGTRVRRNCQTGKLETATCFKPCNKVCENSIMGIYRHPSSPCCNKNEMIKGQCGQSSVVPENFDIEMSDQKTRQKIFPWTAQVKIGTKTCLGAIINDKFVVTSAKCVYRKFLLSIKVITGTTKSHFFDNDIKFERDIQIRAVRDVIIYPRFDHLNYAAHNIALLELREPLKFDSDYISPICLPHGEEIPDGSTCFAFDFIPASKTLTGTNLQLLPIDDCMRSLGNYKIGNKKASAQIAEDRVICAGQLMSRYYSCQGTPGSALMCQKCSSSCSWMLYGVTSYGDKRCTTVKRPGVFTKISFFESWIIQKTGMKPPAKSLKKFNSCQK